MRYKNKNKVKRGIYLSNYRKLRKQQNQNEEPQPTSSYQLPETYDQPSMEVTEEAVQIMPGKDDVDFPEPIQIGVTSDNTNKDYSNNYSNNPEWENASGSQALDPYDEFALALARKIKTIKDLTGRINLMNAVQNLVEQTCVQYAAGEMTGAICMADPSQALGPQTVFLPTMMPMMGGMLMTPQGLVQVGAPPPAVAQAPMLQGLLQSTTSQMGQPVMIIQPMTTVQNASQTYQVDQATNTIQPQGCTPTAKKRKLTMVDAAASTSDFYEVPVEATPPPEFVSFGTKDASTGDSVGEARPQIDILEIKEENLEDDGTFSSSSSAATTRTPSLSANSPAPVTDFINDPLPIKLEIIDDTEQDSD